MKVVDRENQIFNQQVQERKKEKNRFNLKCMYLVSTRKQPIKDHRSIRNFHMQIDMRLKNVKQIK